MSVFRQLKKLLYDPMIKSKPPEYELVDWVNFLWGINERFFTRFVTKSACSFIGKTQYKHAKRVRVELPKYTSLIARIDTLYPDEIHVEVVNSNQTKGDWFIVEKVEWLKIIKHLKHRPFIYHRKVTEIKNFRGFF